MAAWAYPHEFHDGTGEVASGVQVNDNFAKAREKIEALEAQIFAPSAYSARAVLSPETLTSAGTSSWVNTTGKRAFADFDFELHAESGRGCIVNMYVGGVLNQQFFIPENAANVRLAASALVAIGETVTFELAGGGGVKLSGIHVSYRTF